MDGAGILDRETVRLLNTGGVAALAGWTLDDGQGQVYRFPDGFTLYNRGAVSVHTRAGTDTAIDLYWGAARRRVDLRQDPEPARFQWRRPVDLQHPLRGGGWPPH